VLIRYRGRFIEHVLDRPEVRPVWKRFTEHDFVMGMGSGTLPLESFKHYLVQDYLYLVFLFESSFVHLMSLMVIQVHFARSNALASYKGKTMESVAAVRGIRMSFSTRVGANNTV
jgi:hypothetical protein